ncbi:Uncharacterised protein [Vibrio cholerae]|nr:Uncharacterised protein [Vibrio cholerae]
MIFLNRLKSQGNFLPSQARLTEARRIASGPIRAPGRPDVAISKGTPSTTTSALVSTGLRT